MGERPACRLDLVTLLNNPTLIDRENLRVAEDDRPFNHILQFSNIARPRVRLKFEKEGEFKYHCDIYGKSMNGEAVVKPTAVK